MNKDQVEGKYEQLKGKMKSAWGRMTDDDLALYNGKQQEFFGKLQEKQGIAREAAEKTIKDMEATLNKASDAA